MVRNSISHSLKTCSNWVKKFEDERYDIKDKPKRGRDRNNVIDGEIIACLELNKHATCREIADEVGVCKDTVWRHFVNMKKRYLSFRWVPYKLSDNNKFNRLTICTELLNQYQRNNFLNQLICVDETWVYWCNANGTAPGQHHKSWRGAGDTAPEVVSRSSMTTSKQLSIVFWDAKGLIYFETLPRNSTITAEKYCQVLDNLKEALFLNRRRNAVMGLNNFHFLQDNARPHTAAITQTKLVELGFHVLPHPPYSPDLSPCDYYLFSPF